MVRSEILEAIEEPYREGMLVKALDESGEPLLRKGRQVYQAGRLRSSSDPSSADTWTRTPARRTARKPSFRDFTCRHL